MNVLRSHRSILASFAVSGIGPRRRRKRAFTLMSWRDQEFYFGRDGLHLCMHPQDFENSVVTASTRSPFASLEDMLMQLNVSSGVAALPSVVANTIHDNLAVVPLADPEFNCELILLWRKDNKSPALARFLEVVHRYLNEKTE